MKHIKLTNLLLTATLFVAFGCVKDSSQKVLQPENPQLENVTFLAELGSSDSKTALAGNRVCWEAADKVSLFSGSSLATKTELSMDYLAEAGRSAIFRGLAEVNSEKYLAVYPATESCAYDALSSTLSLSIPAGQTAVAGSFGSGANVSVALSSDKNLNFRNIGSLVGISLLKQEAAKTAAIVLKAKGTDGQYRKIAGEVAVTIDGQTGAPAVTGGTSESVTLSAQEGGFAENVIYYFAVLPGEYDLFEFTCVDEDGATITSKTYGENENYTLERSCMIAFEAKMPELPDEFELTMDFASGWPFVEPLVAAADQVKAGEYYTFSSPYPGTQNMTLDLKVGIQKGQDVSGKQDLDGDGTEDTAVKTTHTYSYSEGVLSFDAVCDVENAVPKAGGGQTWGLMGIPGVSGRYVSKVTVYYNGVKYFNFLDGATFSYNSTGASQPKDQQGINPAVFNLPYGSTGQVAAVAGRSYILRLRGVGCKISKIVINYSKNKPE